MIAEIQNELSNEIQKTQNLLSQQDSFLRQINNIRFNTSFFLFLFSLSFSLFLSLSLLSFLSLFPLFLSLLSLFLSFSLSLSLSLSLSYTSFVRRVREE